VDACLQLAIRKTGNSVPRPDPMAEGNWLWGLEPKAEELAPVSPMEKVPDEFNQQVQSYSNFLG
jgi:hypothetical protein